MEDASHLQKEKGLLVVITANNKTLEPSKFKRLILASNVWHIWNLIVPQAVAQLLQFFFNFFNGWQAATQFFRQRLSNLVLPFCHTNRVLISCQ